MKVKPNSLFLIDGIGGLLSALMLGKVLTRFERFFGMPSEVLYILASVAVVLSLYSFSCYLIKIEKPGILLRIIAVANLLYCCFTLVFILYNHRTISTLGLAYFILEITAVVVLAIAELETAARLI